MAFVRPAGDFDRSYGQDIAYLRKPWHWIGLVLTIGFVFSLPYWAPIYWLSTLNRIGVAVIAVQGLNILTGLTGQISLGQAAFMMVGGFTSSLLMAHLSLSFWVSLPLAGLTAGLAGLVFGIPSLRVKGFYLAMATLAAQFIIPWLSEHTFKEFLGGSSGLIRTPVPAIGAYEFLNAARYAHITLVVVILTTVVAHNISRTRLGRSFVAVRDNDLAAELLGVNPFTTKLKAFFIASVFAGIAGSLQAHFQRGVGTEYGYDLVTSIFLLGMLVVGGIGSNIGPFLGAAAIILLEDFSAWLGVYLAGTFPAQATALLPSFRPILFGTLLMLFLIFEPRGIAWRWRLFLTAWRLRPFAR